MREPAELSRRACLEVLKHNGVGRVALDSPLGPHIVPVNYTIHDGAVVFRTTPYSVVGTYARDHDIAFEVGEINVNDGTAVSVLTWGRAEVVDDPRELRAIRRRHDPQPWAEGRRDTYFRLPTRDLTGVRQTIQNPSAPVRPADGEVGLRVHLPDGTGAMIWPLLPTDRAALREHYANLSAPSQHSRFLASVPRLTDEMLDRLVGDVDGVDHVALVLVAFPSDGPEAAAGIARIARYPDRPTAADVAVTVADEWQGKGVATVLLNELMRNRPQGLTQIVTEVATDNRASLAMLDQLGETTVTRAGPGVYEVVVELPDDGRQRVPDNAEPPVSPGQTGCSG